MFYLWKLSIIIVHHALHSILCVCVCISKQVWIERDISLIGSCLSYGVLKFLKWRKMLNNGQNFLLVYTYMPCNVFWSHTHTQNSNKSLINHFIITIIWWVLWSISHHHHLYRWKSKINVTTTTTNKRMSFTKTNANSNAWAPNPITVLMSFECTNEKEEEKKKEILGNFFCFVLRFQ